MKRMTVAEMQQLLMRVTIGRSILFDIHSVKQVSDTKIIAKTIGGVQTGIMDTQENCMLFDTDELSNALCFAMDVDSIYDIVELP